MPVITRALLRKRAEHNEGMISTLEEISLHQEELENINEVLGVLCRKIKILYLQNNIIPRMENLVHLKELEYLNLALNNITKIEGLQNCEAIYKLDLTVNFIDVDHLEESMNHLATRDTLRDLYMMGNPCQTNWEGFTSYTIARLPFLQTLDGTEITKSMQITACQQLGRLEADLRVLAERKRGEKRAKMAEKSDQRAESKALVSVCDCDEDIDGQSQNAEEVDRNKMTDNTPETRIEIYRELAEQKKEKADREKANQPRERDYEAEQAESISLIREKEQELNGEIKQKNEGGWEFTWDEETRPGFVTLDVRVQRFLDSSLIDVDVHPSYISVVIKSKILRLRLPAEVKAGESKCQRSKTTGSLLVTMPKVNPRENAVTLRGNARAAAATASGGSSGSAGGGGARGAQGNGKPGGSVSAARTPAPKKLSLQDQMLEAAIASQNQSLRDSSLGVAGSGAGASSRAVDVSSIVRRPAARDEEAPPPPPSRPVGSILELD